MQCIRFVSGRYITYKSPFGVTEEGNGTDSAENGGAERSVFMKEPLTRVTPSQSVSPAALHAAQDVAFPRTLKPHFLPAPLLPDQPGVCKALSAQTTLRSRPLLSGLLLLQHVPCSLGAAWVLRRLVFQPSKSAAEPFFHAESGLGRFCFPWFVVMPLLKSSERQN